MRAWAMLSTERDGHQFALPLEFDDEPILPIKVYEFADGVFVTAAMAPHADLVGARLVAVGETQIEDVLDMLEPLVPRDGPATVPSFRPMYLLRAIVLRGLGLVEDGAVPLTVSLDGEERIVELEPVPSSEHQAWAGWLALHGLAPRDGLRHSQQGDPHFAVEPLRNGRALYVRFAQVQPVLPGAVDELRRLAADPGVERVIVDLRQNTGGDNTTYGNLLSALTQVATDRPGSLVVLIDRVTFSAAANFATRLEQQTDAIFAGEPMGGGLNFWNDVDWIELPEFVVPMRVAVSTRYWEMAEPDDPRLSIEPDLALPVTASDYFAGRDPLLDSVLAGEAG
jgi:C-terminal processing protease CtpA/Prc